MKQASLWPKHPFFNICYQAFHLFKKREGGGRVEAQVLCQEGICSHSLGLVSNTWSSFSISPRNLIEMLELLNLKLLGRNNLGHMGIVMPVQIWELLVEATVEGPATSYVCLGSAHLRQQGESDSFPYVGTARTRKQIFHSRCRFEAYSGSEISLFTAYLTLFYNWSLVLKLYF